MHRLEYDDPREGATSRMPMTVAVVIPQARAAGEATCGGVAQRWQLLAGKSGEALADAASVGPLRALPEAARLETNLQVVRWPSSVRPDMGGEAEYMLDVWTPAAGGTFAPAPLENTPDVAAITADPAKRAKLVAWVKENLLAIDRGTATLPDELAARNAYSIGPRGLARAANRPFAQPSARVTSPARRTQALSS